MLSLVERLETIETLGFADWPPLAAIGRRFTQQHVGSLLVGGYNYDRDQVTA